MHNSSKIFLLLLLFIFTVGGTLHAAPTAHKAPQIEYVKGEILSATPLEQNISQKYGLGPADRVKIKLTSGAQAGQEVNSINYKTGRPGFDIDAKVGDKIIVAVTDDRGQKLYNVADFDRQNYQYLLLAIFAACLIVFGGKIGLKSVFVIAFSILLIFYGMVSQILSSNWNIILLTLVVSAIITIVTQVTICGWNAKAWSAILGTIGGVVIAGALASGFISLMHLTGLESEEAMMLKATFLSNVNFSDVLFAGIVLGALGAVMDVAISISSAQNEIKISCPHFGFKELFKAGLNVGRDIMGTMSNTLILAYAGSSLPLVLLIFSQSNISVERIMNLNMIATEISRALIGSIGLICSIPITAFITAVLLTRNTAHTEQAKE